MQLFKKRISLKRGVKLTLAVSDWVTPRSVVRPEIAGGPINRFPVDRSIANSEIKNDYRSRTFRDSEMQSLKTQFPPRREATKK